MLTRASTDTPDKLYNLEIRQYEPNGDYIAGTGNDFGDVGIGEHLSVNLVERSDCQLVLVARGSGGAVAALGSKSLEDVQSMTVSTSIMNGIDPSVRGSMNAMPYVLHLEHVKVAVVGGNPVIQSKEGSYDIRLLLKRLATRLTVNWEYNVSGYKLKQLLLQSIPLNYAVVDKQESDGTYPSLLSQFTTLEIPVSDTNAAKGSYSYWVPANVRGESAAATSDIQRTKANAPTGSAFLNFVAVNTSDAKKKLDYRVHIGSGASNDFNMYRNKDYVYEVNFNHVGIPTGDRRVTYIDPIPASENNNNLISTANCFMVAPGGAFCFDPFAFQQNGSEITNSRMTSWYSTAGTGIKSVKLLWQTRENGDVGDPVMGLANSDNDHTNIVDIRRMDGSDITVSPANSKGQCLIYCRVAANTSGGNGAIAAYDGPNGTGNIIWSWHVWITDYNPDTNGTEQILEPVNKRKLRFTLGNNGMYPMMDRNLGAMAGYVDAAPATYLEKSKTNGLHYQWGRKDPFPSSYTEKDISTIDNKNSTTPPEGMLNRYGANGMTYIVNGGSMSLGNIQYTCRNPTVFYAKEGTGAYVGMGVGPAWTNEMSAATWGNTKTLSDPCPAGWRIASKAEMGAVVNKGKNVSNDATKSKDGGYLIYYEAQGSGHTSYFRFTGYGRYFNTFVSIGSLCTVWSCNQYNIDSGYATRLDTDKVYEAPSMYKSDAHTVRCIQERTD
ncbi:DUF4906 domain-containing protein [Bacteroides sp.]|uniref:DUF4906 domain-containing protein n=1 Tax=Bacteroides sp. TaxID=29523 RepID=UPI00261767DE|nr:DUF4906 domain-containing protein [Bacteroides sp.]